MRPKTATSALSTTQDAKKAHIDERFDDLIRGINAGDERAAKELHEACRVTPALRERIGGLEHNALDSWKRLIVPGTSNRDAFTRDHIETELVRRRKELHRDGDSHLETLLINRILSAWLQVMHADTAYAQMLQRGGTHKEAEYHQKRADRARRQLIRAIQGLATVRRLLRPAQVNIGQNQINVAG